MAITAFSLLLLLELCHLSVDRRSRIGDHKRIQVAGEDQGGQLRQGEPDHAQLEAVELEDVGWLPFCRRQAGSRVDGVGGYVREVCQRDELGAQVFLTAVELVVPQGIAAHAHHVGDVRWWAYRRRS